MGLARVLHLDGGPDTAGIKNRPTQRRAGGPGQAGTLGQVCHIQALRPESPGQGQPREEVGGGDPNPRGGGLQFLFGLPNIGPPAEKLGRQSDIPGQVGPRDRTVLREGRIKSCGRLSYQNAQTVEGVFDGGLEGRDLGADIRQQGLGFGCVQRARQAGLIARLSHLNRILLGLDMPLGNPNTLLCAAEGNIVARDLGQQRHQHRAPVFFRRADIRAQRLLGPMQTAEQVNLPACVQAHLVEVPFLSEAQ